MVIELNVNDYHSALYYMGRAFETGDAGIWAAFWADLA